MHRANASLEEDIATFDTARVAALHAAAQARQATAAKKRARANLERGVKSTIKYAEAISHGRESTLRLLGWGPRRPRVYLSAQLPGQPASLRILDQSLTAVTLAWRKSFNGGPARVYRVERRDRRRGPWIHVAGSLQPKVRIKGEPGIECEYRVIATNKKGEGTPSNVVRVML